MKISKLDCGYDRKALIERTKKAPVWLHFGAGNIFRAFPCVLLQRLIEAGRADYGIIAVDAFDAETIHRVYEPCDNMSLSVTLNSDGTMKKTPVGSVVESIYLPENRERVSEIICSPSLSLVTFTITEKGYAIRDSAGALLPDIKRDLESKPDEAETFLGFLSACLYRRYLAGKKPLTMLSMDNCSGNGDRLSRAINTFAGSWASLGFAEGGFADYVSEKSGDGVVCPISMIDKITPRPSERVAEALREDGYEDIDIIETEKHTFIAPFVNAEAPEYLVIEDKFSSPRPPLEEVGVKITDRETVEAVERMKVSTCLNPLHTFLAIYGCLLGFERICDEMKDPVLSRLVRRLGYDEGLPVVTDPGIISPREFIDEVINERLPNIFMPDTPQRIATDTSQKLSVRFGETIKSYMERGLDMTGLRCIPLVAAGWCRYLMGVDDKGNPFARSSDPLLEECSAHLSGIKLGGKYSADEIHAALFPIFSNTTIFGVDLYSSPVGEASERYFTEMISSAGAVRRVLEEV